MICQCEKTALLHNVSFTSACIIHHGHIPLDANIPPGNKCKRAVLWCKQVTEKESGVRQVMSTMGLLNSPFWLTWSLFEGCLPSHVSCLLSCVNNLLLCTALWSLSCGLLLLAERLMLPVSLHNLLGSAARTEQWQSPAAYRAPVEGLENVELTDMCSQLLTVCAGTHA